MLSPPLSGYQDFIWRIGNSDFPTGTSQPTAQTSIKAPNLNDGKIWVDLPAMNRTDTNALTLDLETADNADNVLLRWGNFSKANVNTKGGDDTLVLVGGTFNGVKFVDTIFGDISTGAPDGAALGGGTVELGAGNNHLKVYGTTDLNDIALKATDGTVDMELTGYGQVVYMTYEQFTALTEGDKVITVSNKQNAVWNSATLGIEGDSSDIIDMSQVTIADGAQFNFLLYGGIQISGKPNVGTSNAKGRWGYSISDSAAYTGVAGYDENFDIHQSALSGGNYTGNWTGDKPDFDTLAIHLKDDGTGTASVVLNDKAAGGTVKDFRQLTIESAKVSEGGLGFYKPSSVSFGANTTIGFVYYEGTSNDALDITNLTGTPSVNLGAGNDTLTGLKATHFTNDSEAGSPIGVLDGGTGYDEVTVAKTDALTIGVHLQNFEKVSFSNTDTDVKWALFKENYHYVADNSEKFDLDPTSGVNTVTVDAKALTIGKLTFDASAITVGTFGFTVTGGSGADTFTGSKGADTFTGSKGADKFVYSTLGKSLAAKYDTIKDFVSGTDKIVVLGDQKSVIDIAGTGLISVTGTVGSGKSLTGNLTAALDNSGNPKMLASGAAVVKLGADTYLVLNDGTAAFSATTDDVIKIGGTGTIVTGDFEAAVVTP